MATLVRRLLVVGAIVALPAAGSAQEATLSGTVTDSTGAVLPGVTLTAVHEASGNTFEGLTDERGTYRISARTGVYRVTAVLPGFSTITRDRLELLVGQQVVVNLQLSPSAVQESVTVTGEAPLVDLTSSAMGGNVDPRQTQELPVNGRDWLALTALAPGMRANAVDVGPTTGDRQANREYQLNVDGQEVSVSQAGGRDSAAMPSRNFSSSRAGSTPLRAAPPAFRSTPSANPAPIHRQDRSPATSGTTASTPPTSSPATFFLMRISSSARPSAVQSFGTSPLLQQLRIRA